MTVPEKTAKYIAKEAQYCAMNYFPLPVVLCKGEGAWVWDIEGKRYLDMMSAYSAVSFGHAHPGLLKVLYEQACKLSVTSRAFYNEVAGLFFEKLCLLSGMEKGLPMNTGAEAVETAIKAARRWGYEKKGIPDNCAEIIVAKNNFHGRTLSIISFSSEKEYKKNFGPFTPGFREIPFGDTEALKTAINEHTCAFLVEPIQGEGGIIEGPAGWLKECQTICNEHNVLLILDEIQTGLGRTGKCFAFQHDGVLPDGLILGKALGGGLFPVSVFLGKAEILDLLTPGSHGSTFGGNPLGMRIGVEVLKFLEEGDWIQRSAALGEVLLQALRAIQHPAIKAVRGKGLLVGVELDAHFMSARKMCESLMHRGVLSKETHETVVRFSPPLGIEENDMLWAVEEFVKVLGV